MTQDGMTRAGIPAAGIQWTGIAVSGLKKSFGGRTVFEHLSLAAEPGEFVALVGRSGIGKTTLLRCLAGLVAPDAGEIRVAGHPIDALRPRALAAARRDIGFVFQQFNLVRRLSALDNALGGRLATTPLWRIVLGTFHADDRADAHAALERVGLGEHALQRADELSGGQQQRVAIARALVQRSRVILADEPVASLDPAASDAILRLLRDLSRDNGLTVVCSLHQHELAHRYADRIFSLEPFAPAILAVEDRAACAGAGS